MALKKLSTFIFKITTLIFSFILTGCSTHSLLTKSHSNRSMASTSDCNFNTEQLILSVEKHKNRVLKFRFISEKAHNDIGLTGIISYLKKENFTKNELVSILNSSPRFTELSSYHPNLEKAITDAFDDNIFKADYLFKNLETALKIVTTDIENISSLQEVSRTIDSGYHFLKIIQKIALLDETKYIILNDLTASPFCQRMSIKTDDLINILESTHETSLGRIKEAIENWFPILKKYKNKLLTIDRYDKELEIIEIKDQCGWGSCWLHPKISKMEMNLFKKTGKKIPLSTDYFYLKYIINQAYLEILGPNTSNISEGAATFTFKIYARYFGIIPKAAWTPKTAFHNSEADPLDNTIKITDRFKFELGKILQNKKRQLEKNRSYYDKNSNIVHTLYQKEVNKLVEEYFGMPPETFVYNGKKYTSESFLEKFYKDYDTNQAAYKLDNPQSEKFARHTGRSVNIWQEKGTLLEIVHMHRKKVDLKIVEKTIIDSINNDRAITITTRWPQNKTYLKQGKETLFIDPFTGILSTNKFPSTKTLKKGSHAVLIIGYELDLSGRISSLKILNSHGTDRGDKGIFHMDIDFFKLFLKSLFYNKNDGLGIIRNNRPGNIKTVSIHYDRLPKSPEDFI